MPAPPLLELCVRLSRIVLPSTDVEACVAFFREVLQLEVSGRVVHAGWTDIVVEPASALGVGAVHLAFNVPHDRFDRACEWIASRALVLRDPLGEERFHLDAPWDSQSLYFAGPHGAVLELIARRSLVAPVRGWGDFHGSEIACVSEVGLPTDDVPGLVRDLVVRHGIAPFGAVSDTFAAMGGDEGLLIVVDRERPWFPESRRLPWARGVRVAMSGVVAGETLGGVEGWVVSGVARGRAPTRGDVGGFPGRS
ncbi:VOC family protein [Bacillus sp. NP157]|nr:VOC family protein [Bacillus sp. NP157]